MFQIRRTTEVFVGPQAFSLLYDAHLVTLNETRVIILDGYFILTARKISPITSIIALFVLLAY